MKILMKKFLKRSLIVSLLLSAAWTGGRWFFGNKITEKQWNMMEEHLGEQVDTSNVYFDFDSDGILEEVLDKVDSPANHYILVDEGTSSEHKEYYKAPSSAEFYVSPTRYDYSEVAATLTEGCSSDYEKILAINGWIGRNIAYDTSYTIHEADKVFDKKKGICHGYCELFYRIAEAAGIRVEIVSGFTRDYYGKFSTDGHAWIFAYTRPGYGIFVDPTWDAGRVNGDVFTFNEIHGNWFNMDPEWLILTHFPKDASYQLIDPQMTREEFESLEGAVHMCNQYGMDLHELYLRSRAHTLSLPEIFTGGEGVITALDIPMQSSLRAGQTYSFRVKLANPVDFVLQSGREAYSVLSEYWHVDEDGYYCILFAPGDSGDTIILGLKTDLGIGHFQTSIIIRYSVSS